jgi:hypothetical protein
MSFTGDLDMNAGAAAGTGIAAGRDVSRTNFRFDPHAT